MSLFTRHDAPRLRHLEIAASFVSRLAAWLRYSNALRFCFDFELDFGAVSAGDGGQLQKLAKLTDTPVEDLSHGPIREGRQFRIDGELLSTAYLDRIDTWICPDCAVEDMAAAPHLAAEAAIAVRRDDIVSAIGSCSRHRRGLVKVGRAAWKYGRHDTSLTTMDVGLQIEELQTLSPRLDASPIDVFARKRFSGQLQGYDLLDPMPLNLVIKLSGRFGQWVLNEGGTGMRQLDRIELNRFYSAGLQVLAGGRDGIAEAIERRSFDKAGKRRLGVMLDVQQLLGEDRGVAAVGHLREVVAGAARDHRAALPFKHRRIGNHDADLINIDQAKERYNTGPKAVEAFARAAGAMVEGNGATRIDGDRLDAWMRLYGGIAPAWKVAQDIGATDYQMAALVDAGLLVPVIARSGAKKSYDWFRPAHVDAVMNRMVEALPVVDAVPDGMITMTQMLARTRGALPLVNRALVDRAIPAKRLAGEKPYAGVLVNMDDVMALIGQDPNEEADFVTLDEFAEACGFNSATACTLAVLEIFRSEMRINPASGMLRRMVPKAEVKRFGQTYISAARLADQLGGSPVTITAKMIGKGIDSVDTGKARITLFERGKVAHLLPG